MAKINLANLTPDNNFLASQHQTRQYGYGQFGQAWKARHDRQQTAKSSHRDSARIRPEADRQGAYETRGDSVSARRISAPCLSTYSILARPPQQPSGRRGQCAAASRTTATAFHRALPRSSSPRMTAASSVADESRADCAAHGQPGF